MKTKILCIAQFIGVLFTCSCSDRNETTDLPKEGGIPIGLSENNIYFDTSDNTKVINTEYSQWDILYVIAFSTPNDSTKYESNNTKKNTIESSWFKVTKNNSNKLFIQVSANASVYQRKMEIVLFSGSAYEKVIVKQEEMKL